MFTTLLLVSAAAVAAAPIYMMAGAAAEEEDDLFAPETGNDAGDADREGGPDGLLDIAFTGAAADAPSPPDADIEATTTAAPKAPSWARDGDVFDLDAPEDAAADTASTPHSGGTPPGLGDRPDAGPRNSPGQWDKLVLSPEIEEADRPADPLSAPDGPVLSAASGGAADAPADPWSDTAGTALSPETDDLHEPLAPGAADAASTTALPAVDDFVKGRDMLEVTLVTHLAPEDVNVAIQPSADGLDGVITANDIPVATVDGAPDLTLDDLVVQYQAPLAPSQG